MLKNLKTKSVFPIFEEEDEENNGLNVGEISAKPSGQNWRSVRSNTGEQRAIVQTIIELAECTIFFH